MPNDKTELQMFKRKRLPDGTASHMSLETHIADVNDNPHPQYALKSDIASIKAGLSIEHEIEDDRGSVPSLHVVYVINSRLTSLAETVLTVNVAEATYSKLDHTHAYNEVGAASAKHDHDTRYSWIDHNHNDVYATINHTHTEYVLTSDLSDVGIYPNTAKTTPNTDYIYSPVSNGNGEVFEADVEYFIKSETDPEDYETYSEYVLTKDTAFDSGKVYYVFDVGTEQYVQTSDDVMKADTEYYEQQYVVGSTIPANPELFTLQDIAVFDFDTYTTQGQYYIHPSDGVTYHNVPDGVTEGLLYVNTCEIIAYDDTVEGIAGKTSIVQQLISSLGTYKRNIIIESTNTRVEETLYVETTDTEFQSGTIYYIYDEYSGSYTQTDDLTMQDGTTYYVTEFSTSLSRSDKTVYGEWIFLNDNNPIGSLLFMTGNIIPAGYIEADGAAYFKDTYRTLWKFVYDNTNSGGEYDSALVLEDMKNANLGCYGYIGPVVTTSFPDDNTSEAKSYIGGCIALFDGRLSRINSETDYTSIANIFQNTDVISKRSHYLLFSDIDNFTEVKAGTTPDSTKAYFKRVHCSDAANGITGPVYKQVHPTVSGTSLPETIPTTTDDYDKYYTCKDVSSLKPILITKANVDDVKNKFSVPALTDKYVKMWSRSGSDKNGSYLEAGLPNIRGFFAQIFTPIGSQYPRSASGAFKDSTIVTNATGGFSLGAGGYANDLTLDASDSNTIYGNSDTVTPESINIHVLIKAYQGSIIPPDADITSIEDLVSDKVASIGEATTSTKGVVRLATTEDVVNKTTGAVAVTPTALSNQNYVKSVVFNGNTITPNKHTVNLGTAAPAIGNRNHQVADVRLNDSTTGDATYTEWTITDTDVINADVSLMEVRIALRANSVYNALGYPKDCIVNNPLCVCKNQDDSEYLCTPQLDVYKTSIDGVTQVRVRLHWPLLWYLREFDNTSSNTYPLYKPAEGESLSPKAVAAQLSFWDVIVNLKY